MPMQACAFPAQPDPGHISPSDLDAAAARANNDIWQWLLWHMPCAAALLSSPWCAAGEASVAAGQERQLLQVDLPLDGRGPITIPAEWSISPIASMWLTLFLMYIGPPCSAGACLQSSGCSMLLPHCGSCWDPCVLPGSATSSSAGDECTHMSCM